MKVIVAPDKFKGSLTSLEVCNAVKQGILQSDKNAEVVVLPMADGGDGFATVVKYYLQTETVISNTVDPLMRSITAMYEWDEENKTAVIELAAASGLLLLHAEERNPLQTSTYGTGLLIRNAIAKGAKKIILGLGGSATNDAGIGILAALGFVFKDAEENELAPVGKNLLLIKTITVPLEIPIPEFVIATDVTNVLFGKQGAAFIYAPQKGADESAVKFLDKGLEHFAGKIKSHTGKDINSFEGSGGAGGVAAGLFAFFNIQVISGAKYITSISGIESILTDTDIVITGEGKLDKQSDKGKVIQQISSIANQSQVPVIALCGEIEITENEIKQMGLQSAYSLINTKVSKEESIKKAAELLQNTAALLFQKYNC